jgi:hypothetical protein
MNRKLTQAEIDAACKALIEGASEVEIGGQVAQIVQGPVIGTPEWTAEEQARWVISNDDAEAKSVE